MYVCISLISHFTWREKYGRNRMYQQYSYIAESDFDKLCIVRVV